MAMNLCHRCFQPRLHCDQVSTDGYEVENLTKDDGQGFMAERFIKPPVTIVIEFPCNVEIHSILINPVLGSQKTTGIEILSQSRGQRSCWLTQSLTPAKSPSATTDGVFSPLGRCFSDTVQRICFKNNSFRSRPPYSRLGTTPCPLDCTIVELRSHNASLLRYTSHIMVRLVRTSGGGIPVLRTLQIWGQPSASCKEEIVNKILHIYRQRYRPPHSNESSGENDGKHVDKSSSQSIISSSLHLKESQLNSLEVAGVRIPPEFIDHITCEVMSLPVLLPSGHTIDQSTLDKHVSAESSWGRCPSDPYTGVLFTQNNKPVSNNTLKSRIDQFLLKNNIDVTKVPRTLGFQNKSVCHLGLGNGIVNDANSERSGKRKYKCNVDEHGSGVTKETAISFNPCNSDLKPIGIDKSQVQSCSKKLKTDSSTLPSFGQNCEQNKEKVAHEAHLNTSLAAAISDTLSSLPSYRKRRSEQAQKTSGKVSSEVKCTICEQSQERIYSLKCRHLICHECLLNCKEKVCKICQATWTTDEVTKIYIV